MVASRRLKVKGRFVFQNGKFQELLVIQKFKSQELMGYRRQGGPVEDTETEGEKWGAGRVKPERAEGEAVWHEGVG